MRERVRRREERAARDGYFSGEGEREREKETGRQ